MRCTCESIAPAVRILPLPASTSVAGPITRSGCTPSIVSGLPALPSATIRPSRMPTSALMMPQWSTTIAPVMIRSGAPSARCAGGHAHRFADHLAAAEHRLLATEAAVLLDLDQEVRVGQANAVAGGGSIQGGVPRTADLAHRRQSVCGAPEQSIVQLAKTSPGVCSARRSACRRSASRTSISSCFVRGRTDVRWAPRRLEDRRGDERVVARDRDGFAVRVVRRDPHGVLLQPLQTGHRHVRRARADTVRLSTPLKYTR